MPFCYVSQQLLSFTTSASSHSHKNNQCLSEALSAGGHNDGLSSAGYRKGYRSRA